MDVKSKFYWSIIDLQYGVSSWAFQMALVIKNPSANAGDLRDLGLIPGSERSLGGGHGNSLQYSSLENPMNRGAWRAIVYGVAKSRIQQSDKHFWVPKYHIYMFPKFCSCNSSWCLRDESCPEVKLTLASWSDSGSVLKSHLKKCQGY